MSEFVEVKTADLVGSALDYATGIAAGAFEEGEFKFRAFNPSTDWGHAGAFIERFEVTIYAPRHMTKKADGWAAHIYVVNHPCTFRGATPLIAACRAIVASVLGETVSVPRELLS
ncbi:phage protein NinX family protein [Pseudomonas alliivorans]|nr:phage protein NinX family protein [Pseudomonas alliivorans]